MTLSIFHTDCPVKTRTNYNLIPGPICILLYRSTHWTRDQLLSRAGEDFSGAKYFPMYVLHRDLNYSGLLPTDTTSDPRSIVAVHNLMSSMDQGSVLAVHCTKTALMRCDVQHNQKLSQLIWVFDSVISKREYIQYNTWLSYCQVII